MMGFRSRILRGDLVIGCFVKSSDSLTSEVLTLAGFDFLVLDVEHGAVTIRDIEDFCRAVESRSGTAVIRLPSSDAVAIARTLDAGAAAVQLAWVSTPETADRCVNAAKYPPQGRRGLAASRATGYGAVPLTQWVEQSNSDTVVVVQLETREALSNAAQIARVPGVDVVFLGPTDLSVALGHPGDPQHPDVVSALETTIATLRSAGTVIGAFARDLHEIKWFRDRGVTYLVTGMEPLLKKAVASLLDAARNT